MSTASLDLTPRRPGLSDTAAGFAAGEPAPDTCAVCGSRLAHHYFEIAHRRHCERCRFQVEEEYQGPGEAGLFGRATLWGSGAALFGGLVYYAFLVSTDFLFGFVAILVGWLVGTAVRKGSKEKGGLRFQALAAILTYLAIASTAAPNIVASLRELSHEAPVQTGSKPNPAAAGSEKQAAGQEEITVTDQVMAWFLVFLLILVSPFLSGTQTLLVLLILSIGIRQAWRINRREELVILGPFSLDVVRGPGS